MNTGNQPDATPTNKVLAGSLGAAVATILVYLVESLATVDLPVGVEGAIIVLLTFAAGYVTSESAHDDSLRR